ncbi:MAG: ABC transporter ATP-binding protein [Actinobacteria bacterium]|nr:ABC transporter ATP-binding protein [Actinomycetota bacterium]
MGSDAVLEVTGLRKAFRGIRGGRRVAVDGLDMTVPAGVVHGFLGPNGSGKTTTLRIVLGLVRADAGAARMLGRPVPAALPAVLRQVGAIVEQPQFFPAFSGRRNLRSLAGIAGLPPGRVEEVLELVGLRDRAKDRYKTYSLGMKQRLAIGAALLRSPRLLILDEPMNGLDPAGIHEVRETMRRLTREGASVLLSSHILAEVEQVCDSVSIISRGRHVRSGSVSEVLAGRPSGEVLIRIAAPEEGIQILTEAGFGARRDGTQVRVSGVTDPALVTERLAQRGHYLAELTPVRADLESVFLELTGPTEARPEPERKEGTQ